MTQVIINTITYIIILIIAFFIYIFVLLHKYTLTTYLCSHSKIYKKILLSYVKNKMKSGDLLLFSYNLSDLYSRPLLHRKFPHIGIIIELNNELFTVEMLYEDMSEPKQNNTLNGIYVLPLDSRIKNYNGDVYYGSLKTPLTNKQQSQFKSLIESNKENINYPNPNLLNLTILLNSKYRIENSLFCSEYISYILQKLNISSIPYNTNVRNINTEILNLCDGIVYTQPIHIIHDDLLINNIQESNFITYC